MVVRNCTKERRSGSLRAPMKYFLLESVAILLVVYIMTGGDVISVHGLIMGAIGLAYPLSKLPKYMKRAETSNRYNTIGKRYS